MYIISNDESRSQPATLLHIDFFACSHPFNSLLGVMANGQHAYVLVVQHLKFFLQFADKWIEDAFIQVNAERKTDSGDLNQVQTQPILCQSGEYMA